MQDSTLSLIHKAGAKTVMLSHVLYESLDSDLPASLSPVVQKMLREEFHFNGIMLTDAVDMKALANNYSRKEIVEHSVGQHADLVEAGDLDLGIELADYVKSLDTAKFKKKYQRLRAIPLYKEIKFVPPAELLKSVAVSNNSIRRNVRSYSEDVEKVASHGSAYVRGLQEAGVSATAKHFPGHGGFWKIHILFSQGPSLLLPPDQHAGQQNARRSLSWNNYWQVLSCPLHQSALCH